jgi:hypothetical protein
MKYIRLFTDHHVVGEFKGYLEDTYQGIQEFDFFQNTFGFKRRWIGRWFNLDHH